MLEATGGLPDAVIACVGGGSNSIGMFHPFIADTGVEIIGFEAGGTGKGLGMNAATLSYGSPGVLHGVYSMLLQDVEGQVQETTSVSAGLDYPGVGPEHALLHASGRVRYEAVDRRRGAGRGEGVLRVRRHPAGHRKRARAGRCEALGGHQPRRTHCHLSVRPR